MVDLDGNLVCVTTEFRLRTLGSVASDHNFLWSWRGRDEVLDLDLKDHAPLKNGVEERRNMHSGQWFSNYGPQTWESASLGDVLEVRILTPYPRATEKQTRQGTSNLCFPKLSRWFWCSFKFENHCSWGYNPNFLAKLSLKMYIWYYTKYWVWFWSPYLICFDVSDDIKRDVECSVIKRGSINFKRFENTHYTFTVLFLRNV